MGREETTTRAEPEVAAPLKPPAHAGPSPLRPDALILWLDGCDPRHPVNRKR